jgi:hypothetical protein
MSTAAAGLQLATDEPNVSPASQNIYSQTGRKVWLFSAESLNLAGRHLPAHLQQINAFHLVQCRDHYYLDIDPDEGAFNQAGDGRLDLVPILKNAFAVAEEIKTFARERGCAVLDMLTDVSSQDVGLLWPYLFRAVPENPTIPERIEALPWLDGGKWFLKRLDKSGQVLDEAEDITAQVRGFAGFDSVVSAISEALQTALSWREFHMTSRLASLGPRGFSQQERLYFAEAGLQIPDEASANRAQDLAEVQGSALGDSVGTAIGNAIANSQQQTASVIADALRGIGEIVRPMQQELAELRQLKEVVNAKGNDQSAQNGEGKESAQTGKAGSGKPAGNKPTNAR